MDTGKGSHNPDAPGIEQMLRGAFVIEDWQKGTDAMREYVELGATGMKIYPVGLGCMGFSHAYGAPTEKHEAIKSIRAAYDMGYNFFDTAECYTGINSDGSTSYNSTLNFIFD